MPRCRLGIVSDIHYACAQEQARGEDYEFRDLPNPALRFFVRYYRRYVWLKDPLNQNHLLEPFLNFPEPFDVVVGNGDFSCDTRCIGVSDDVSCESARECLQKLRDRFGPRFYATFGDHELGKFSFVGKKGGLRLASWRRARAELGMEPFWTHEVGCYTLAGVASSLIALPAYEIETLPEELTEWRMLREEHLEQMRAFFRKLLPEQRVILFCHDPTALPFLLREGVLGAALSQIEQTILGHLHSNVILRMSRWLSGMPRITFLGHTARRLSTALGEARCWRPFKVRLCPSLSGLELFKDGGFLSAELDLSGRRPAIFHKHRVWR